MNSLARVSIILLFWGVTMTANAQEYVYWTSQGDKKIERNDLIGSSNEDVVTTGLTIPSGIDVHVGLGVVYWTDEANRTITRAYLDGSNATVIYESKSILTDLDVDETHGKIYWIDQSNRSVLRADLGGSNVEVVLSGLADPAAIALDEVNSKLYWVDSTDKLLQRSNLDGSGIDVLAKGLKQPSGVAIYSDMAKVYWTDEGDMTVKRANLDGSNVELIVQEAESIQSVANAVASDYIYWIDSGQDRLRRSTSTGQFVETISTRLGTACDFALLPATSLPVELAALNVRTRDDNATLSWTTLAEADLLGFEVEHLQRGTFSTVGFVAASNAHLGTSHYEFTISDLAPGHHSFRMKTVSHGGEFSYSSLVEVDVHLTSRFSITDPYPNPSARTTRFSVTAAGNENLKVEVTDLLGRIVDRLYEGQLSDGQRAEFTWDAGNQSGGIYFIRITGDGFVDSRKVVLVK